jgi:hypothetical protein
VIVSGSNDYGNNRGNRWTQRAIVALADVQHGVVAHWQLVAEGMPIDAIQYRMAQGLLVSVHKGVYALGRRTLTPNGHRMAAVLSYRPPCVLSHRSAAAVWGIWSSGPRIEVTLERKSRSHAKIRAHYTATLDPEDVATKDNIPLTSPARTLLDLARTLKPHLLVKAIEEAERRHIFDLMALDRAIARAPGRRGVKTLRAALAGYRPPPDTRSPPEQRFYELIRSDPTIPDPQSNVLVAGLQVDFFWPGTRLVVEVDGRGYHSSPRAFETDRVRDAKLARARCPVLRITDERMRTDRAGILTDVRALSTPPHE